MPCNEVRMVDPQTGVATIEAFVAIDYSLDCGLGTHSTMVALAYVMFVLVPIGFPAFIFWFFRAKWRDGELWIPASRSQEGAVFDDALHRSKGPTSEKIHSLHQRLHFLFQEMNHGKTCPE